MINFLKSENYKLLKSKGIYITYFICIGLVILMTFILYYFGNKDTHFRYYNSSFYFNNVVGFWMFIVLIGAVINLLIVNSESLNLLKQTVSFGITRRTVFIGKLILSLLYFFVLCLIITIIMVISSQLFFPKDDTAVKVFLVTILNMSPIIFGGITLAHALNISRVKGMLSVIIILLIMFMSSKLFFVLSKFNKSFKSLYDYSPNVLMNHILNESMAQKIIFTVDSWVTGLILAIISIIISYIYFTKKDI